MVPAPYSETICFPQNRTISVIWLVTSSPPTLSNWFQHRPIQFGGLTISVTKLFSRTVVNQRTSEMSFNWHYSRSIIWVSHPCGRDNSETSKNMLITIGLWFNRILRWTGDSLSGGFSHLLRERKHHNQFLWWVGMGNLLRNHRFVTSYKYLYVILSFTILINTK